MSSEPQFIRAVHAYEAGNFDGLAQLAEQAPYRARPIKRTRRSKADMDAIRDMLFAILVEDHPQTIRGVFYQASVRGVVPKTDDAKGYGTVQRLLAEMRRSGDIPYAWIADSTRWMRKPRTWSSAEEALRRTAETYRRALWDGGNAVVEIWLEKEALAGVLVDVTERWDAPLMVTRGYPSMSFLHSAAEAIAGRDQWTYIYYFGDRDPSGVDIDRAVVSGIGESIKSICEPYGLAFASVRPEEMFNAHATFTRAAVSVEQIEVWNLPTRPTKKSDSRSKHFKGDSVELDAIPARGLRHLAEQCIELHVDHRQLGVLQKAEAEERRVLERMAASLNGSAA
jgi:hypothetical protein